VDSSAERLDCTDLDGYLSHHHDMIILTAINDARRSAQERERSIQRKWLQENWQSSRQRFLESLGHRPHMRTLAPSALSSQQPQQTRSSAGQVPAESIPFSLSGTPSFRAPANAPTNIESSAPAPASSMAAAEEPAPPLPEYLQAHISAVRVFHSDIKQTRAPGSSTGGYSLVIRQQTPIFASLGEAASTPTASFSNPNNNVQAMFGLSEADITGYRSVLTMLSYMTGEQRESTISQRGEYLPACFPVTDFSAPHLHAKIVHPLSWGAKEYLETRFNEKINRFIDENARSDRFSIRSSAEGQGWNTRLCSCLAHLFRQGQLYCNDEDYQAFSMIPDNSSSNDMTPYGQQSNSAYGAVDNTVPLWAFVYYALAAGNVGAAIDMLSEFGHNSIERNALRVLQYLHQLSNQYLSTYSESHNREAAAAAVTLSPDLFRDLDEALSVCRHHFESIFQEDDVGGSDPYQLFVLNLLSLTRRDYLANPDFPNYLVENYLWSSLWFAYHNRLLLFCGGNAVGASASSANNARFVKYALSDRAGDR
jgi:hypothetical protein